MVCGSSSEFCFTLSVGVSITSSCEAPVRVFNVKIHVFRQAGAFAFCYFPEHLLPSLLCAHTWTSYETHIRTAWWVSHVSGLFPYTCCGFPLVPCSGRIPGTALPSLIHLSLLCYPVHKLDFYFHTVFLPRFSPVFLTAANSLTLCMTALSAPRIPMYSL